MFSFLNKYLLIGMTVALVLMGGALYVVHGMYVTAESARVLAEGNLKATKESFDKYRTLTAEQSKANAASIASLSKSFIAERTRANELEEKLARHDFSALTFAKPGLVETIINTATKRKMKEIQEETK